MSRLCEVASLLKDFQFTLNEKLAMREQRKSKIKAHINGIGKFFIGLPRCAANVLRESKINDFPINNR